MNQVLGVPVSYHSIHALKFIKADHSMCTGHTRMSMLLTEKGFPCRLRLTHQLLQMLPAGSAGVGSSILNTLRTEERRLTDGAAQLRARESVLKFGMQQWEEMLGMMRSE